MSEHGTGGTAGSRPTVLSVVGARPQFVKALPVSSALSGRCEEVLVHTGQHYDEVLSEVFFEELPLPRPDHNLGVGSGTHAEQTAAVMRGVDPLVEEHDPDVVLVYGDTNSTLAAALVAAKRAPALAHVEAGLRSDNREMPEEVNRVLTDHCSEYLFTPSPGATSRLRAEGIAEGVHEVGDVMYDAVLMVRDRALEGSTVLSRLGLRDDEYVLATVHRASNTDDPDRLAAILDGLASVSRPVVFPVHPRTEDAMKRYGLWDRADDELRLIEPVGYLDFLRLLSGACCAATDSGGVQKEAFYLDTPCVTLRDETEWTETVRSGWNELTGADPDRIRKAITDRDPPDSKPALYGDGTASDAIAETLLGDGIR